MLKAILKGISAMRKSLERDQRDRRMTYRGNCGDEEVQLTLGLRDTYVGLPRSKFTFPVNHLHPDISIHILHTILMHFLKC